MPKKAVFISKLDLYLDKVGLYRRTVELLSIYGVFRVGDLVKLTKGNLREFGFTYKRIEEIRRKLRERRLRLGMKDDPEVKAWPVAAS